MMVMMMMMMMMMMTDERVTSVFCRLSNTQGQVSRNESPRTHTFGKGMPTTIFRLAPGGESRNASLPKKQNQKRVKGWWREHRAESVEQGGEWVCVDTTALAFASAKSIPSDTCTNETAL